LADPNSPPVYKISYLGYICRAVSCCIRFCSVATFFSRVFLMRGINLIDQRILLIYCAYFSYGFISRVRKWCLGSSIYSVGLERLIASFFANLLRETTVAIGLYLLKKDAKVC